MPASSAARAGGKADPFGAGGVREPCSGGSQSPVGGGTSSLGECPTPLLTQLSVPAKIGLCVGFLNRSEFGRVETPSSDKKTLSRFRRVRTTADLVRGFS
mmetsp:Transcript_39887/g.95175  ORF Transcript_39887/g.95175 Transcript_39887/m.95175 type:complete len:100 (+) Transcript_39887:463-762(+)